MVSGGTGTRFLVKEIFGPTLQGEGFWAGSPCVFLRFAVCNLACTWCDTDFAPAGATKMTTQEILAAVRGVDEFGSRRIVVTGGEPALQWKPELADAIKTAGYRVHFETNGTRALAAPVDWLTVSPKPQFHESGDALVIHRADECKLVLDDTVTLDQLKQYEASDFANLFLQPCDDPDYDKHLKRCVELATHRPRWRVSLQMHKILNVP